MQWLVFALLVVGSSVASFVTRERRFRRRWQNVELPAITVGRGAYREGPATGAMMPSAPLALRLAALSCLVYVDDPDPGDDLRFEAWWVGHPHLAPVGGSPVEVWTWEPIRAEDVGVQSFKFTVIADPFARFDLDVTVLEAN